MLRDYSCKDGRTEPKSSVIWLRRLVGTVSREGSLIVMLFTHVAS